MAWTSMHFAVGMLGGGAIGALGLFTFRRGARLIPVAMTLGGIWACIPDLPRFWREDFPWLPAAAALGSKDFERWLHGIGDLFFGHAALDAQPHEYALHGLIGIILLYNLAVLWTLWLERRQRNSLGNRHWRAHGRVLQQFEPELTPIEACDDAPQAASGDAAPAVLGRIDADGVSDVAS